MSYAMASPGLILRISDKGTRSWSVLYRRKSDSRRRRCTCGTYPQVSLADARAKALEILARVARGEDPARVGRSAQREVPRTFGELAERYLRHAQAAWSGLASKTVRCSRKTFCLRWPASRWKRSDVPTSARSFKGSSLAAPPIKLTERSRLSSWNSRTGAGGGPCGNHSLPRSEGPLGGALARPHSHDRRNTSAMGAYPRRAYVMGNRTSPRLCLVTGQRVGEVAGARKSEINLSDREWRLPGHRVKNGSAHNVPLSSFALDLFQEAIIRSKHDEVIFPSRITKRALTPRAVAKAMFRSLEALGLKDVTPHDLRRTAATGMAKLGVSRLVVDKVLNHVSADRSTIAGVYDRHAYEGEKRCALEFVGRSHWGDLVGHESIGT